MKKSIVALAVSVLPIVVQANAITNGVVLSGSVTATYNSQTSVEAVPKAGADGTALNPEGVETERGIYSYVKGKNEVGLDASLTISASEVLSNGMIAEGSFKVADGSDVLASLSGAFGTLTVSEVGLDATYIGGDVGGVVDVSEDTGDAITYQGTIGDVTVGFAKQTDDGEMQAFATMEFQGIKIGFGTTKKSSINRKNVMGLSYTIEGFTLKTGRETGGDTETSASYTNIFGDFSISAEVSTTKNNEASATYTMGDLAVTAKTVRTEAKFTEQDENGKIAKYSKRLIPTEVVNTLSATYTTGDLSISASSDNTMSINLDMGNADLTLERVSEVDQTITADTGLENGDEGYQVKLPAHTRLVYKVSF